MTRSALRCRFTFMIAELVVWARGQGMNLALDETKTDPAEDDDHLPESRGGRHPIGTAGDLLLYIPAYPGDYPGVYQETTEAHRLLGERWKLMGGTWGGDFPKPDGNHYELR